MESLVPASLFIAFLWGIQPVIHKYILKSIDPKTILILTTVFYSLCSIAFAIKYWRSVQKDWKKLTPIKLMWIGIAAILSGFVANLIYLFVLKKHKSYLVSALIYAAPAFTLLLSYFLLKEDISIIGFIGVILVIIGTICIAFFSQNA